LLSCICFRWAGETVGVVRWSV